MKHLKLLIINAFFILTVQNLFGQFKFGIEDYSIAITEVQYGIPFLGLTPINPGFEIGATFLKKEKTRSCHQIGANMGYFYHKLLVSAPYLKANYTYQPNIKNILGIDMGIGIGYLHGFYPGESYQFDEDKKKYVSTNLNSFPAFTTSTHIGMTYIKSEKINPFIKYEGNMLNFSEFTSILMIGTKFNF